MAKSIRVVQGLYFSSTKWLFAGPDQSSSDTTAVGENWARGYEDY